jgi:hypothetical protein
VKQLEPAQLRFRAGPNIPSHQAISYYILNNKKKTAPPFPPHIILKKNLGGRGGSSEDIRFKKLGVN